MSPHSEAQAANSECETIELSSSGDVALVVSGSLTVSPTAACPPSDASPTPIITKRFITSSTILSHASPYFERLFSPMFKEGSLIRQQQCPDVRLEDDDVKAMEIILSVLHFQNYPLVEPLDVEMLARVAKQCDKYQCQDAMRPSLYASLVGLSGSLTRPSVEKSGLALVAAYLLCEREIFGDILSYQFKYLPLNFVDIWHGVEIWSLLPRSITDKLHAVIMDKINELENELHNKITMLAEDAAEHALKGSTTQYNRQVSTKALCTTGYRIPMFMRILKEEKLWSSAFKFQTYTLHELWNRFILVHSKLEKQHRCTSKEQCSLIKASKTLREKAATVCCVATKEIIQDVVSMCKDKKDELLLKESKKRKFSESN